MASDLYAVVDSFRAVETFGGLDSRDVQRVVVQAQPSGIAFAVQFTANQDTFDNPDKLAAATAAIAKPYASYVDAAMATPGVLGIYAYSTFTPSQTQEDRWVVTIASTSGETRTEVDIARIDIRPERFPAILAKTQAGLDAIEASGQ